jgi:tetratricopeptide (TPR) repeat protein
VETRASNDKQGSASFPSGNGKGYPARRNLPIPTLAEILQMAPDELSRLDLGLRNLVCATGLPGAEDMDIPEYMRRLEVLAEYVRKKTQRQLPMFRENPGQFHFPRPVTENFFRIIVLVHALKTDAGLRYNPERADQKNSDKPFSAKEMLINGLLSDERIGTCNTIPVVIAAVGRRLGYPLYLCCTHQHVWTRWDGGGERFNIEASGPNDFSDFDDDHFRSELEPMRKAGIDTSYYLKNLTPADELALFLFSRGWVLEDHKRFEEGLPGWAKCCFLAPTEPMYSRRAYEVAFETLHVRKFGKPSVRGPDRRPLTSPAIGEDLRKLLPPKVLGMFLSIDGHFHEVRGEVKEAVVSYRKACAEDPQNPDYRADLERYLKRLAHEGKSSYETDAVAISLRLDREMATECEQRGLRFEKAEDWAHAQCAFVQGSAYPRGGTLCGEHLKRTIRKEIAAGKEQRPGPQAPGHHGPPDPRFALPHELQATIWTMQDLALRSVGRMDEALAACKEACRLWPTHPLYAQELRRFSQEHARLKAQEEPPPQAHAGSSLQGQFVSGGTHNVVFTSVSAPVHASVTCFSGSLFPPITTIKPKE